MRVPRYKSPSYGPVQSLLVADFNRFLVMKGLFFHAGRKEGGMTM